MDAFSLKAVNDEHYNQKRNKFQPSFSTTLKIGGNQQNYTFHFGLTWYSLILPLFFPAFLLPVDYLLTMMMEMYRILSGIFYFSTQGREQEMCRLESLWVAGSSLEQQMFFAVSFRVYWLGGNTLKTVWKCLLRDGRVVCCFDTALSKMVHRGTCSVGTFRYSRSITRSWRLSRDKKSFKRPVDSSLFFEDH